MNLEPVELWPVAVVVLIMLVPVTVWAYLGNHIPWRRIAGVVALRLLAFGIALLAILRPFYAWGDKNQERQLLLILVDRSRSMGEVKDHGKDQSRYAALLQHLEEAGPEIKRLVDEDRIDVVFRAFGAEVVEFDPASPLPPTDARTDIGAALRKLHEDFAGKKPLAVLLLTDGADTGGVFNTLDEARRYRAIPCPVNAFAFGNPNTPNNVRAVSVESAVAEPSPVMAKGELTVRTVIDAPGFVGRTVRVKVLTNQEEVKSQDVELENSRGNEIKIKCTAPAKAGEYDLTVKVEDPRRPGEPPPGQVSTARNELSTFLTVAKEGISVLLVDKQREEATKIFDALQDRRIRVNTVWIRSNRPVDPNVGDLFQFAEQQYDVIILGDVTAEQMRAVNPKALEEIEKLVGEKGAGFMMIGGYSSFARRVWKDTPIEKLLPVFLDADGQVELKPDERGLSLKPTDAGLRRFSFLLKQGDRKEDVAVAGEWEKMAGRLDGHTRLGTPKSRATVLATTDDGKTPLLVAMTYGGGESGEGRVLAFGGDTTNLWIQDDETLAMHTRFWKQTVLWLARQEEPEGAVWLRPKDRRLRARTETWFTVGLRKGDFDVPDGEFTVKLFGPGLDKDGVNMPTTLGREGRRGDIDRDKTKKPGVYRLEATGSGKDAEGNKVEGTKEAKFIVYDDDLETTQQAADHAFLKKVARAGNGEFHEGKDLALFLRDLHRQASAETKGQERRWPDWKTDAREPQPPSPFRVLFYLFFVAVLGGEWLLRRRWGMV
jgi:uncharacterized membrane protein